MKIGGLEGSARSLLAGAVASAILSGCVTTREQEVAVKPEIAHAYLQDKPAELQKHFYVMLAQDQRNQVLNDMRLGLATIEAGEFGLAESLFDDALQRIEAVYAYNDDAKQARQLFVKEVVKDFKGEPYERAMAYFYRGLLYLRGGDYENARASFKGGALQDAFAEDDQFRADFALMPYLQGWAARCGGNPSLAKEDFKEFLDTDPAAPVPGEGDNLLVLIETGGAPVKFSATDPNSTKPRYLKFRRSGLVESAVVSYALPGGGSSHPLEAFLLEDVFRQASTRGGREFDSVLAGKAQFKDTANVVGNAALVGAAVAAQYAATSRNQRDQNNAAAAAAILLVAGVIAKSAAEAAEPNADTRYWDNLPERIQVVSLAVPSAVDRVSVDFYALGSKTRTKEAPIWRAGDCGVAWVRGQSAYPIDPRAPNSAVPEQMASPVVIPPLPQPTLIAAPAEAPVGATAMTGTAVEVPPATEGFSMDRLKDSMRGLFSATPAQAESTTPAGEAGPAAGPPPAETQADETKAADYSIEGIAKGISRLFAVEPAKADAPAPGELPKDDIPNEEMK